MSPSACFSACSHLGSSQFVVCILAEDFTHGSGQFELYQHALYISPANLLVIRLNLLRCFWTYSVIPHEKGNILMIIIVLSACQRGIIKSAGAVYLLIDSKKSISGVAVTRFMMF